MTQFSQTILLPIFLLLIIISACKKDDETFLEEHPAENKIICKIDGVDFISAPNETSLSYTGWGYFLKGIQVADQRITIRFTLFCERNMILPTVFRLDNSGDDNLGRVELSYDDRYGNIKTYQSDSLSTGTVTITKFNKVTFKASGYFRVKVTDGSTVKNITDGEFKDIDIN